MRALDTVPRLHRPPKFALITTFHFAECHFMKPSRFEYRAPETLNEAVALLAAEHGAKLIAGGQSLMPMLAFRLAAPSLLVDLRRLPGLGEIAVDGDGVRLGARVRWRDIEDEPQLTSAQPLLQAAVGNVAHYQIRNRGTVGGSLAHADPAAELPGIAITCEGEISAVGAADWPRIPASEFFTGALTTELHSDEVITELRLPPWPAARRWGFEEFASRQGDFALAGIALYYDEDEQGRACNTHVGVIGACSRPHRLGPFETALDGRTVDEQTIATAARAAAAAVDPPQDLHADAEYRRALVTTLVERALRAAAQRRSE
jgi:aerobic carbon-monoxide dehydrogenase medium subunit